MRRTLTGIVVALLCCAVGAASAADARITDQQREDWAKGLSYVAGRVAEGERAGASSRENAVNRFTIINGALGEDGDIHDPEDANILDRIVGGVQVGARILGTLDAQRRSGTWATVQNSGLDNVGPMGDANFRAQLDKQGLEYEDHIDLENGMQAFLLVHPDTGRAVILMRGTEFSAGTMTETTRDVLADAQGSLSREHAIGRAQYEAAKPRLDQWVDAWAGNVEVIGHSLGGALGQRLMLDRAGDIRYGTFFNTPGLEKAAIARMAEDPALVLNLLLEGGQRKVRIFNAEGDPVSAGGDGFVLGDVIMAAGKSIAESPHLASVFGEDVRRKVVGYYDYAGTRGALAETAGFLVDFLGMLTGHVADPRDMKEVLVDLETAEGQLRAFQQELSEELEIDAEDAWRVPLKDLLTKVQVAENTGATVLPVAHVGKEKVKGQTLEVQPVAPVVSLPGPEPKLAGINGEFEGTFGGGDEDAYVDGGQIGFDIAGTRITGRATGRVVSRHKGGGADEFNLRVEGTFDPARGTVRVTIRGKVGIFSDLDFLATGRGGPDGFEGEWTGWFDNGRWNAQPKRVRAVTWTEYICATYPDQPEVWAQHKVTCP